MKNLRRSEWQKSCTEKGFKQSKNTRDVISGRHLKTTYFFPGESPSRPGQGHVYLTDGGLDCCSNRTISFHYIKPEEMYALEYLIYRIRTKWRICENVISVKELKINLKTKRLYAVILKNKNFTYLLSSKVRHWRLLPKLSNDIYAEGVTILSTY